MHIFLTSILGGSYKIGDVRIACPLLSDNGFLKKVRALWPKGAKVLMICAAPDNYEKNDSLLDCFHEALEMSGLSYSSIQMCDDRTESLVDSIGEMDVVILTGGHVPTQNAFFKKIGLKEKLGSFDGILMALSAGSMNCAETVYAGPELEGEAIDPNYQRWIPGLGLTDVNIYPHFQYLREETLDGLRLTEDITMPDSRVHDILALNDGSYIEIDETGETTVHGEAYLFRNGGLEQICSDQQSVKLK